MRVYVCMCVHACVRVYVCMCVHACVRVYVCVCMPGACHASFHIQYRVLKDNRFQKPARGWHANKQASKQGLC